MNKYQIYCQTDNKWEEIISTTAPTQCPIDSGHTVDIDSVAIISSGVLVNDGTCKDLTLNDYKQLRYNEIDYKTQILISAGFTYDGKLFSLSVPSQINWSEIHSNISAFPDPVDCSCKDSDTYSLAHADVNDFWVTAKDTVKSHLDSGRVLKKSVYDASTEAEVDAVIDNR